MVVVTHFSWEEHERLNYLFPFWIDMAVPIFMLISGYVYTISYKRHEINKFESAYSIKNNIDKLIRYTIPYIITFIIEEIYIILGTSGIDSISYEILTFIDGGRGPGSYYYPVMIQFVFIFPIIFFIINHNKKTGLILCGFLNIIFEILQRTYDLNSSTYRLLIFRYLLLISVGCHIAAYGITWSIKKSVISIVTGISFIVAYCYLGYEPIILRYWTRTSFLACLYIMPIASYLILKFKKFSNIVLALIGKSSFHIFLTQMVWYYAADARISNHISSRPLHLLTNIFICVIAGIAFYMVSMPITKQTIIIAQSMINKATA